MTEENPKSELARLRKEQRRILQNEIYGGLSQAERAEYDKKTKRIDELKRQFEVITLSDEAQAEQRRDWSKKAETDTPQSEDRQPYRAREKDSTDAFTDSLKSDRPNKNSIQKTANRRDCWRCTPLGATLQP